MHSHIIPLAALVASVFAQGTPPNLTAALAATPELSNLTTYVAAIPGLLTTLANATNITILAPSNEAFKKFLETPAAAAITKNDTATIEAVLRYHVLSGVHPGSEVTDTPAFIPSLLDNPVYSNVTGGQVVEAVKQGDKVAFYSGLLANATVTTADLNFTGGVIHVIDSVLTVPVDVAVTAEAAGLTALVGAVKKAELVDVLDGAKDLTIFAPSNAAFDAIGSALGNLTAKDIASILQYHVVGEKVKYSTDLTNGTSLKSLAGGELKITVADGHTFVNSAKVIKANVLVAQGVVHVIDNVLNPNATEVKPVASAATQSVAFASASSIGGGNPLTSGIAAPTTTLPAGPSVTAATTAAASTSGAAAPVHVAAIEMGMLFAGAAVLLNV